MTYINEEDILAKFTTLILLKDGTRIPRGQAIFIKSHCKACGKPMAYDREINFHDRVGSCFSCTTGNPLDFCIRTRGMAVDEDNLEAEVTLRKQIAPSSTISLRRFYAINDIWRYFVIELWWTFDPAEAYLNIGEKILKI